MWMLKNAPPSTFLDGIVVVGVPLWPFELKFKCSILTFQGEAICAIQNFCRWTGFQKAGHLFWSLGRLWTDFGLTLVHQLAIPLATIISSPAISLSSQNSTTGTILWFFWKQSWKHSQRSVGPKITQNKTCRSILWFVPPSRHKLLPSSFSLHYFSSIHPLA